MPFNTFLHLLTQEDQELRASGLGHLAWLLDRHPLLELLEPVEDDIDLRRG